MHLRRAILSTSVTAALSLTTAFAAHEDAGVTSGPFQFTPLAASSPCVPGGAGAFPHEQPFLLPSGYEQTVIAREGDGGTIDNWDMHVLNENGQDAGEFLYHSHETTENGMVSVTDLRTGETRVLPSARTGTAWTGSPGRRGARC